MKADLSNPCDILTESFFSTLLVKNTIGDSTPHCGYSLNFNSNVTSPAPSPTFKSLATMPRANHTLLKFEDGRIKGWGNSDLGQLGYGNISSIGDGNLSIKDSSFIPISQPIAQLTAGSNFSCALFISGDVQCWGSGNNGRLGYGNTNSVGDGVGISIQEAGILPIGENVIQVHAGSDHACALLSSGNVRCWGSGNSGKLGYNNIDNVGDGITSIQSAGNINIGGTVTHLAVGSDHNCALLSTGTVRCWGFNASGQLGYNNTINVGDSGANSIINAGDVSIGGTPTQITIGFAHTCVLLSTGTVRCWGVGSFGRLGYNNTNSIGDGLIGGDVPIGETAVQITAGFSHTCALLSTGNVRCWGSGANGKLGYNSISNIADGVSGITIQSAGDVPIGEAVREISAGASHTCALLASGSVRCWGAGANGKLGYNSIADLGDGVGSTILQAGDIVLE
ncbi:RCC1 domain-containing protein [Leptospira sp. GIMC2001]|uniref:RCC1 domain-containing protein n=1 Tax=Leptospira sp. GIMC2001 TaxID=1513297 RepID=UPI00234A684B|nr:hypothetical protein [Leptospira sp. GIMC2001]WCL51162.1 hypothetical protein O4O04_10215 [Leptospira sp. GIMC2001]